MTADWIRPGACYAIVRDGRTVEMGRIVAVTDDGVGVEGWHGRRTVRPEWLEEREDDRRSVLVGDLTDEEMAAILSTPVATTVEDTARNHAVRAMIDIDEMSTEALVDALSSLDDATLARWREHDEEMARRAAGIPSVEAYYRRCARELSDELRRRQGGV